MQCSCELPRATKINHGKSVSEESIVHRSQNNAVEYCCFVTENLCDNSGKVICIKLLLIDFTPNFHKTKHISVMLL